MHARTHTHTHTYTHVHHWPYKSMAQIQRYNYNSEYISFIQCVSSGPVLKGPSRFSCVTVFTTIQTIMKQEEQTLSQVTSKTLRYNFQYLFKLSSDLENGSKLSKPVQICKSQWRLLLCRLSFKDLS